MEQRCRQCQEMKPLRLFPKRKDARNGHRKTCRKCYQGSWRRFDRSVKGKARWLRKDHGYSVGDSLHLASLLLDPYTRCAICGVPRRWLLSQEKRGLHWKGLSVDHIEPAGPSTLTNTRILCRLCNGTRGAKQYTDAAVLHRVSGWYEWRGYARKDLWWLCTSPGVGGLTKLGTKRLHPL